MAAEFVQRRVPPSFARDDGGIGVSGRRGHTVLLGDDLHRRAAADE